MLEEVSHECTKFPKNAAVGDFGGEDPSPQSSLPLRQNFLHDMWPGPRHIKVLVLCGLHNGQAKCDYPTCFLINVTFDPVFCWPVGLLGLLQFNRKFRTLKGNSISNRKYKASRTYYHLGGSINLHEVEHLLAISESSLFIKPRTFFTYLRSNQLPPLFLQY